MTVATANSGINTTASSDIFQILLQDESGQTILGIDDGTLRQTLQIIITNISGRNIESQNLAAYPVSPTNYHFRVRFRPGTLLLSNQITLLEANQGWKVYQEGHDFYFLFPGVLTINNGNSITLSLQNISAAPEGGSRGTRVEVIFDKFKYQGTNEELGGTRLQYLNIVNQRGRQQIPLYAGFIGSNTILNDGTANDLILTIQFLPNASVNFQVVGQTPETSTTTKDAVMSLQAAQLDSSQVNDSNINIVLVKDAQSIPPVLNSASGSTGSTEITYYLQGTQTTAGSLGLRGVNQNSQSQGTVEEIVNDGATKFTISFDTDNSAAWALTTPSDANGVSITVDNQFPNAARWVGGKIERIGMAPQWSFICETGWSTTGREEILRLRITNLKTNLPPGYANLYVNYENIPGYWDGRIRCPIHKGALVYRNDRIGVGTNNPNTKLEVAGGRLRVSRSDSSNAGVIEISNGSKTNYLFTDGTSGHLYLRTDSANHHLILQGDGASHGNVGIGTTNPLDRLQVGEGAYKTAMGKSATQELDYGTSYIAFNGARNALGEWVFDTDNMNNGGVVIYGGIAHGLSIATIPSTGGTQKKLSDRDIFNAIKLRINANGNVGIGTTNPQAKLEVPGGAIFSGVAVGVDPPGDVNPPFPYETVSTTNTGYNLRLHSSQGIHFHAGNQSVPQMGIYANGNVEIITDLLLKRFPANDTTQSLTKLSLVNRRAGGALQEWALYTSAVGGGFGVNPNAFEIWEYPATLSRFQIRSGGNTILVPKGGNVGIGTESPLEQLHVSSNLRVDGELRTITGQKPIIAQRFSQTVSTSSSPYSGSNNFNTNYQADAYFVVSSRFQTSAGTLTLSNINNLWHINLSWSFPTPGPGVPTPPSSITYTADLTFIHRSLIHRIGL